MEEIKNNIIEIINNKMDELGRKDLYRQAIVGFSSADDSRYDDLKEIVGDWHKSPKELFPQAKTVISYYIPFTKKLSKAAKRGPVSELWAEAYIVINKHFSEINAELSDYLQEEGYVSQEVPATHTYSQEDLKSMWSHRSAAKIAGIGDFMANNMFMTEKGCAGRLTTLFTSAIIESSDDNVKNKCLYKKDGSCHLCFDICPVKALKSEGVDRFVCNDELIRNLKALESTRKIKGADVCGKCVSICPYAYIE